MTGIRNMKGLGLSLTITLAMAIGMAVIYVSGKVTSADVLYLLKTGGIFLASAFLIFRIQRKYAFHLPSFYLFAFFIVVPIFGIVNYHSYMKIFSDFLGVHLDLKPAFDLWMQGTFCVVLGVFLTHAVRNMLSAHSQHTSKEAAYTSWDWKHFHYILFILAGISFVFTVAVLVKIGYIPILRGNIDAERFTYSQQTGEWTLKLARLWLVVYLFAFIKLLRNIKLDGAFHVRKNLPLIFLLLLAFTCDGIYGDRIHQFIMVVFSLIMINKSLARIPVKYLLVLFVVGTVLALFVQFVRSESIKAIDAPITHKALMSTFSEYTCFAYTIQEYPKEDMQHGRAFWGTIAPVFPKQIWRALNVDKDRIFALNSAAIMRDIFGAAAGIRIGIMGEGFINFGYWGILIVPLAAGILFGIMENVFISLRSFDVREIVLAFVISVAMYLPVAQTNALTSILPVNLLFMIIPMLLFRIKVKTLR